MHKTGIALFVYNRPEHCRKVLEFLKKNNIDKLYIFSDGPKKNSNIKKIKLVREIINSIDWCDAEIIEHKNNKGLANSIVDGVNYVLSKHDRIIVLEDDCVPSEDFVHFMNTCFDKYENDEQIMNVSGYAPPIKIPADYPYDIYFSYRSSSWGWGTWRRAWKYYNRSPLILQEVDNSTDLKKKVDRAGKDLYPMLKAQIEGKLDSWAVFWSINIIKNEGLCINPVESRIMNIGHDGTGVHCHKDNRYEVYLNKNKHKKIVFPASNRPDERIIEEYHKFISNPFLAKILRFCRNKINKFI
ncbi:glycosyl transferase, group 1/2 family protein [Methanosalsum zhilinae DSM 4017]|uniref:Glycosyl transferase, group 1/2 family protein n=1 Tax=Methanosalsum zhilinae (strain DSM 4017 / NBRC 107636 / OCM 62 / WeN5) TaxID=679901 RepID=F7XPW3_METZD|nr:glycosyltransferase [Methanosalsum zhilinae]AEH61484.1 glycosyl transferase, group 1/2 family protein [Methanosalsum zhilinae DSM 4017]